MTVGVPEINLDTWGLKYVKKKGASTSIQAGNLAHDTPSQKIEEQVSSHDTRSTTAPDSDVKISDPTGKPKQTEQKHEYPAEKDPFRIVEGVGRKDSETKHGKVGQTGGSTARIGSDDTKREEHGQKHLTSEGKILGEGGNLKRPLGVGETASQDSGIRSPETRTGRTAQDKPVKGGREGKTHGALPKVKAEMELAIIKCKLLKMNDISKILPALAAGAGRAIASGVSSVGSAVGNAAGNAVASKIDPPDEEVEKSEHKCVSCGQKVPKDKKGSEEYSANEKHQIDNPASSYSHYKSNDEVVEKAIELINEAYDEMKSSGFKKLKPVYEGDTKEAKKDAPTGTGSSESNVPSKRKEQALNEDIRSKRFPNLKEPQDKEGQRSDQVIGDLGSDKKEGREDWVKVKDGGTSTTSSEGGFNHVYSDVHEAKRQKQNQ